MVSEVDLELILKPKLVVLETILGQALAKELKGFIHALHLIGSLL